MRNTYLLFIQMITGALVAVFGGLHLGFMHLDAILGFFGIKIVDVTSWSSMIERARQWLWVGIYVSLLVFGLVHALNGLRNVLLETNRSPRTERVLTGLIIAFGVVFLILGVYAPFALISK